MKQLTPIAISALVLMGCDQPKSATGNKAEATKTAINNAKTAVDIRWSP
ncbi:MAG: hypothetical protein MUC91_00060 [Verrucomicrobia bacterium]|jgi:PBP1b-binding outer membrane lipoprotein LpoB|nr:hypothetical protein [Verrucomicrobiota bacterium]